MRQFFPKKLAFAFFLNCHLSLDGLLDGPRFDGKSAQGVKGIPAILLKTGFGSFSQSPPKP